MTADGTGGRGSWADEALRIAAAGLRAGKGMRAIAVDLFGPDRVDEEWTPDGPMRAIVRRLVSRACDETPAPGNGPRAAGRP